MNSALILILIPLFFSVIIFFSGKKWAPYLSLFSGIVSIFYFLLLMGAYQADKSPLAFNTSFFWIPSMRMYFHVGMDAAAILPLLLTQLVITLSTGATLVKGNERGADFYGLIGLTHAALNGFFAAQNPVSFFIFFEAALVPVYLLVLSYGGPDRKKAVFKFFLYTAFGGLLMLAAILFLQVHMHDHLRLESWEDFYQNKLTLKYQYWLLAAFFIAFAIKSPIFPFHTWQADLYSQADKPTVMIIAALLSKMGVYGLIRFDFLFIQALYSWFFYLIPLCLVGVIYGALIAWRQKEIDRILAYSSLSHMGLIAAGILTLTNKGIQGGLFAMLAHGLAVAGLFFVSDVIARRTQQRGLDGLGGLAKGNPRFAAYFFIIVLSAVGLPLTCGFIGEFYLIWAITDWQVIWGFVAAVTIILGAAYMLRLYQRTMFGAEHASGKNFGSLSLSEDYVFIIIVVLILALGFFPADWIGLGQYAFNHMNYIPTK
ncbi:MAG TPA: NADH-quinone oxidoreductase subunit M [Saprospiraceae bacterium]|nr:NADH-quinone oxidoreductase subunit M [Saprospiraceae bacterium]